MKLLLAVATCLLLLGRLEYIRCDCIPRNYGKGSIVCVCNVTYCDKIGRINPVSNGEVLLYESTKAGKRFQKSVLKFSEGKSKEGSFLSWNTVTVNIDAKTQYQTLHGFGGAFTDATGINLNSLPENMQDDIISLYYSPEDLDYNIGRVPMASTDFSTHEYSYDDVSGDMNLTHFALTEEDYKLKIPYIKKAEKTTRHKLLLFASPWSAPAWMKNSKRMSGAGKLIGKPGEQYYKTWSQYFVKFFQAYEANNISFWGVTAENEPINGFIPFFPFQCMAFSPESQRDFIKMDLGPALSAAGYGPEKLALMIMDDQRYMLPSWARVVLSDPEAAKYVQGIAVHWYWDFITTPDVLDMTHKAFPEKFILASEACEGDKPWVFEKVILGSWERGENYASDILEDLLHWVTGWIDWNLALDLQGGPNWVNNFVDAPVIVNASAKEIYKQPMYYALGHFSKFLPPGSKRIDSKTSGSKSLEIGAFLTPENATVLIVLNRKSSDFKLSLNDPRRGTFQSQVPSRSMQSYIWWP